MSFWHIVLLVAACLLASTDKQLKKLAWCYFCITALGELTVNRFVLDHNFYAVAALFELSLVAAMLSCRHRAGKWVAICSLVNCAVWLGCFSAYKYSSLSFFFDFLWLPSMGEYFQIAALLIFSKPIYSRLYIADHQHKKNLKKMDAALWLDQWNYL